MGVDRGLAKHESGKLRQAVSPKTQISRLRLISQGGSLVKTGSVPGIGDRDPTWERVDESTFVCLHDVYILSLNIYA